MPTNCKTMPRREIFNCKKEVYITFDAKSREEFTLIFNNEKNAYEFAINLRRTVEEVDRKGHYSNSKKVKLFTDSKKRIGKTAFGEDEFSYIFSEDTNPRDFHEAFSQTIWGDTAD